MTRYHLTSIILAAAIGLGTPALQADDLLSGYEATALEQEVAAVEAAFAKTMADRDFDAFASFLDEETVFWGPNVPDRGRDAVMMRWRPYYDGEAAPFSWAPETVLVLNSGTLAHSTGPVKAPDGTVVAYYHSTWRKNADGDWKIIFDKGQRYCPPTTATPQD
ncbi:YybH family protein [Kordiimonas lacus]|uniref:Ketosteroid isomerase homolog n=1 Tax=Kordiimonas lacus TaxID=637679 RepID=A0A1G6XVL3_9PROT|nr:nuclear transport factor 2 family protein [Kordiimonas lacus]SDD81416.1 Ketosteroid isomerase homolog [Kordiimonas lacus]